MEQVLLNVIAVPAVEKALTDWLLARDSINGFSSSTIKGHGSEHGQMNISEQVAGRREQVLIQIQTSRSRADVLISDLKRDFGGTDIHYWILPVLASGHLK